MCSGLREFNGKYASEDGRCLIIDGTLNSFAPAGLTEYTIPNSVTTIGNAAIRGCSGLTSVTITDSVTTIRDLAFAYCDSLTSVTISDSVTTIGGLAFAYCSNLENVYNYSYTPQVADIDVFLDCSDNLKIYVPHQSLDAYKSAEGWREYADKIFGCPPADEIWYTSTNGQIVTPNSSASFGANIISNTYENGRGVIKFDGVVTEIGYSAFWFASTLKSILIPNSVTKIGSTAFVQCDNLVEIYIPDSVTDIYDHAIVLCDKITTITIGDGVKHIGEEAFADCSNLTTLTIGKNIEEIGWKAFSNCPNLKDIYCKAVTPPVLGWNTNFNNATFYVPAESYWDYVSAEDWAYHKDCIVAYDFENNCIVATPAQTKPARNEIWYTSLNEEVIEPNNTSAFGANIVSNTYENGKGVIKFDGEVTEIGDYAFGDSSYLSEIIIPSTVTNIGNTAFYNCMSLCRVDLWATTPPTMGWDTFFWCSNIVKIYVPVESLDAYLANDYWRSIGTVIFGR